MPAITALINDIDTLLPTWEAAAPPAYLNALATVRTALTSGAPCRAQTSLAASWAQHSRPTRVKEREEGGEWRELSGPAICEIGKLIEFCDDRSEHGIQRLQIFATRALASR